MLESSTPEYNHQKGERESNSNQQSMQLSSRKKKKPTEYDKRIIVIKYASIMTKTQTNYKTNEKQKAITTLISIY